MSPGEDNVNRRGWGEGNFTGYCFRKMSEKETKSLGQIFRGLAGWGNPTVQPQGWKSFFNLFRELICGSSTLKRLMDKPEWRFANLYTPDPRGQEKQEQGVGLWPFCLFRPSDQGLAAVFWQLEKGWGWVVLIECLRWCKTPRVPVCFSLGGDVLGEVEGLQNWKKWRLLGATPEWPCRLRFAFARLLTAVPIAFLNLPAFSC